MREPENLAIVSEGSERGRKREKKRERERARESSLSLLRSNAGPSRANPLRERGGAEGHSLGETRSLTLSSVSRPLF